MGPALETLNNFRSSKTEVTKGESLLTLSTIMPSLFWREPKYFVMAKGVSYDKENIIEIITVG